MFSRDIAGYFILKCDNDIFINSKPAFIVESVSRSAKYRAMISCDNIVRHTYRQEAAICSSSEANHGNLSQVFYSLYAVLFALCAKSNEVGPFSSAKFSLKSSVVAPCAPPELASHKKKRCLSPNNTYVNVP